MNRATRKVKEEVDNEIGDDLLRLLEKHCQGVDVSEKEKEKNEEAEVVDAEDK